MAEVLRAAQFGTAFSFSRAAAAAYRDAGGLVQTAPADAPRFDHDGTGTPLGLLTGSGAEPGAGDRLSIETAMLPADMLVPVPPYDGSATVFHRFDTGAGEQRRAWYSRDARATINALLAQAGHHKEIGVIRGHKQPNGDVVRYRGQAWLLPPLLVQAGTGERVTDGEGRPVIACGAERLDGA